MYIPKDINKCLKEEAKRAGRTNSEGLVVAPVWSKLFLQADYIIAKQADEIERLREERDKLKETLRFYADPNNYEWNVKKDTAVMSNVEYTEIIIDDGVKARDALKEKE